MNRNMNIKHETPIVVIGQTDHRQTEGAKAGQMENPTLDLGHE